MSGTQTPQVVTVGSMAIDSIRTPVGQDECCLGGAAVHGSMSASFFARVGLVGVVGEDYPPEAISMLEERGIDLAGVQHEKGKTFFWKGYYEFDMGEAHTEDTQLNVFANFHPELPEHYREAPFVFLANIDPELQLNVLNQVRAPKLTAADTMNFWISSKLDALIEVVKRVDVVFMNDAEIRQFTSAVNLTSVTNVVKAAKMVLDMGPKAVIVKKGAHGAAMFRKDADPEGPLGMGYFSAPAYPLADYADPTGAGDSFAGGFIGTLARLDSTSDAAMRQAIITGSVMASFNVADFSVRRVRKLTMPEIEARYAAFEKIVHFDAMRTV